MPTGSCLCGAVRFVITGDLAPGTLCHCGQCRKQAGHAWASTHIPRTSLRIDAGDTLRWYSASTTARRGFCGTCGSNLFWDPAGEDRTSVALGALDAPSGARLTQHIFAAHKGDYYDINDTLPHSAGD
ncbi:MAG: GFA family protein [Marinibacterium sp.]|nr:GFA family protein [Marinibacterium sp.]